MHTTKINYHMYKLNQVITASENQLLSYGEKQLVLNITQSHWVIVPTGAFALVTWRHRVIARPGAVVRTLGTGWCHQPVPIPPSAFGTG